MIDVRKILTIEYTAIILLWTLVIISPLLFMDDINQNWMAVHVMWIECAVVGFAFVINRFVLMPLLFFKRRYVHYILSLVVLFLILSLFVLYFDGVNLLLSLFGEGGGEPLHPPAIGDMPPPQRPPVGASLHRGPAAAVMPHTTDVIPPMFSVLILSVITIALDMGLRISMKWVISEQKQAKINNERIMAQLQNLQSQVSPHFFMNTLNNIHALVEIDAPKAKQTIIELSGLMDYLLYDSSTKERVSLQREIDFLSSYINLMRLRFAKRVKIEFSCDEPTPAVTIPPLIFLNFIENSFKYGVDSESDSFVNIRFEMSDSDIVMIAINSNHSSVVTSHRHGLGIKNALKRLDLLYGDSYLLDISDKEDIFYVKLKIPTQ